MDEIEKTVEEKMKEWSDRKELIDARIAKLNVIHEDVIVLHRYDNIKILTFLATAENQSRLRTSWYGRVVKVSDIDCGDEIREGKKKLIKKDDIIVFNPDAAYSLNVAGFEEIWILHVDSVLAIDSGYDYEKSMESNARKVAEIGHERNANMIRGMEAKARMDAIHAQKLKELSNQRRG